MGTVLLRVNPLGGVETLERFSPLLDGDGVASIDQRKAAQGVPSFSPLLDGDGVASLEGTRLAGPRLAFQSPSRWGRCCFRCATALLGARLGCFSPLLDGDGVASHPDACFLSSSSY